MGNARETIIMVDDDITSLIVGKNALSKNHTIFTAPSGNKLFQILEKVNPALILLDIEMPDLDGYEVIKILKANTQTSRIPVIFLTAKIDPESEVKGLNLGAVDYITKPFSEELLIKRVDLHIQFEKQKIELLNYSHDLEGEINKKTKAVYELQDAILKTVAELVECRDSVTGGHIERTQRYLSLLVNFMLEHNIYTDELSKWDLDLLITSSQLHDVGKISIKDDILMKPGELTGEEFEEMKKHTVFGVNIIKKIEKNTTENEFLEYAAILAGSHHEKWDGSGYPLGLKGHDIPLHGRLMAIVDVYDALTNDRPYKKAFTHEEALEIIRSGIGKHFDPLIDEVFLTHEKEFKEVALDKNKFNTNIKPQYIDNLSSTLKVMTNIMDSRIGTESSHTENVQNYLKIFVNALLTHEHYKYEVAVWDTEHFLMSAQLHDIGKIAISDSVLNMTGQLSDEEHEDVKNHANLGVKIIQKIKETVDDESLLHHAEALAGSHHEKWDGTGYPLGLKGKGIPLQGRILAIIDVYESLVNDHPQRDRKTHIEAVEIIKNGSGAQFDPGLVEVFLENEKSFEEALR